MALKLNKDTGKLEGYVAVFDSPSLPISENGQRFTEIIRHGAFSAELTRGTNIRALSSHDGGKYLASTGAGTLTLKEDMTGLWASIDVPPTPTGQELLTLVQRGEEFGGSFGALGGRYRQTGDVRELIRVEDLGEVTVTALPAYPGTLSRSIQKLEQLKEEIPMEKAKEEVKTETPETKATVEVIERSVMPENTPAEFKPIVNPVVGLTKKDAERYSILRAVRAVKAGKQIDGLERECSDEIARQSGRTPKGNLFVPANELKFAVQRSAVDSTAVSALQQTFITGYVDILRNSTVIGQVGATILDNLVGHVSIPKATATSATYWVTEGNDVTQSNPEVKGSVNLVHKTCGTYADITRSQYEQTSYDVETLVRSDMVKAIALGIDAAVLQGSNSAGQPLGLLTRTDIPVVTLSSGALTNQKLVDMETSAFARNVPVGGSASYVGTPAIRGKLKTTEKGTAGFPIFLYDSGEVNNYPFYVSNQLVDGSGHHNLIFSADWSNLLVGYWSGLDLQIDTITLGKSGGVRLIALQDVDTNIRYPEAFCIANDVSVGTLPISPDEDTTSSGM